jgi:hypothetical protein
LDFDFLLLSGAINPYYEYFNNKNDHRRSFSYNIDASMEIYLPYDFEIDVDFEYYGKQLSSQGYTQVSPSFDIYISKKLFKNKATLGVCYSGLFFPSKRTTVIEQEGLYQWQQQNLNYTGFSISFRYFFQKGKEYKTEKIEKYMESDTKGEEKNNIKKQ